MRINSVNSINQNQQRSQNFGRVQFLNAKAVKDCGEVLWHEFHFKVTEADYDRFAYFLRTDKGKPAKKQGFIILSTDIHNSKPTRLNFMQDAEQEPGRWIADIQREDEFAIETDKLLKGMLRLEGQTIEESETLLPIESDAAPRTFAATESYQLAKTLAQEAMQDFQNPSQETQRLANFKGIRLLQELLKWFN